MENNELYTLDEVSERVKLARRTLYRYVRDGRLKAVKIGNQWRVSAADLADFMEHGTK